MDQSNKLNYLRNIISTIESKPREEKSIQGYRFDIFKGSQDDDGKITKIRSIGNAYIKEGFRTYTISLKTFLQERFYLLPNSKPDIKADYLILTRESAQHFQKKYFWNSVGEGKILDGVNHGIMKLSWDVLADHIYMSLHPMQGRDQMEARDQAVA